MEKLNTGCTLSFSSHHGINAPEGKKLVKDLYMHALINSSVRIFIYTYFLFGIFSSEFSGRREDDKNLKTVSIFSLDT